MLQSYLLPLAPTFLPIIINNSTKSFIRKNILTDKLFINQSLDNMKKIVLAAVALICMTMSTTVLTSCGSDDSKGGSDQPEKKIVYAVANFGVQVTDDMFKYGDFTIEYYDANGQVQTEKLTDKVWSKNGTKAKLPAKFGMRLKGQMKPDADLSGVTSVKVGQGRLCRYGLEYSNGEVEILNPWAVEPEGTIRTIAATDLAKWFERHEAGFVNVLYIFDANGKVTEGEWQ